MLKSRLYLVLTALALLISLFSPIQSAQAASTKPTAPQNLRLSPTAGGYSLSWLAPSDTATGITGYQAEYSLDGSAWTIASNSIAGNGTSYTMLGLAPNTLYYVRLAAVVTAGTGPYAYPWTKIYGTANPKRQSDNTIQYQLGFGTGPGETATTLANSAFTRVRYRMSITVSSVSQWADVDFENWAQVLNNPNSGSNLNFDVPGATVPNLRIPTFVAGDTFTVKTNVNDMTVNSSMPSLIGAGKTGRLELWPWNYTQASSGMTPAGNDSKYDFDDSPYIISNSVMASNGEFGSFQVHDLSALDSHTVFAWNYHTNTSPSVDLGIGPNPNTAYHPDWTFCGTASGGSTCTNRTPFLLEIFVNIPSASGPLGIGTISIDAISGAISKRTSKVLTARTPGPGYVTFYANGRKITGCVSLPTSANTATCSWKPLTHGQNIVTASFSSPMYTAATAPITSSTVGKR